MKSAFFRLSAAAKFSGLAAILFFVGYVQAAETGERKIKVDELDVQMYSEDDRREGLLRR